MTKNDTSIELRPKHLDPRLYSKVGQLYSEGFFEEAVSNAFKVLEEKLRQISGTQETGADLAKTVFHQANGILADPNAWPSEREGMHLIFRGAFLAFRNTPAHRFTEINAEEAFDLIVFVNRLLLIAEEADQRLKTSAATTTTVPQRPYRSTPFPVTLDTDGDGRHDLLVQSSAIHDKPFDVFDLTATGLNPITVNHPENGAWGMFSDAFLADMDGDGLNELVIYFVGATTGSSMVIYRRRHGEYEFMDAAASGDEHEDVYLPAFLDPHIDDYDHDGLLEVVSAPWGSIPQDLLPDDISEEARTLATGRVRYVYKWKRSSDRFELLKRELGYLGGR